MKALRFGGALTATLATVAWVAAGFVSASPAYACTLSVLEWDEAFDASSLVVKGKAVNRRLVFKETRIAPKPKPRMADGARFVRAPWDPETTTIGDFERLWFLYADIEVDEVLSGTADDLVTIVIGPARDEADLATITLPIGLSDTVFMLDNTGLTDNVRPLRPLNVQYHSPIEDLYNVMRAGVGGCPGREFPPAIFRSQDYQSRAIVEYAAKR